MRNSRVQLSRAGILLLAITTASGCRAEYSARYSVPTSDVVVAVDLKQINPPLAEYNRVLSFGTADGPGERVQLFPDPGGYALVNLYRIGPSTLLVKTSGNDEYRFDLASRTLVSILTATPGQRAVPHEAVFWGAFDFDSSKSWRFMESAERPEREIDKIYEGK